MSHKYYPDRSTYNALRDAQFEAVCYPGLPPDARSYPGPPCADKYQPRGEPQFDDSDDDAWEVV